MKLNLHSIFWQKSTFQIKLWNILFWKGKVTLTLQTFKNSTKQVVAQFTKPEFFLELGQITDGAATAPSRWPHRRLRPLQVLVQQRRGTWRRRSLRVPRKSGSPWWLPLSTHARSKFLRVSPFRISNKSIARSGLFY